ncbi:MAG TPA: NAD-dependent epimerase/dehydratase family protein, partial [Rhodanobacteraceae bacterium]|nr:NAD-dependent epimerase/dehydratase family protein [Rhodanobacteraceae bacterium]
MSSPEEDLSVNDISMQGHVLITGGAGFVGVNLAARLLSAGADVLIYDNLSRAGVDANLRWLRGRFGGALKVDSGDVRDADRLRVAVAGAAEVYHLAAQVSVTSSLTDPANDSDINLRGTLNLLEAARRRPRPPPIVFASTSQVYGALEEIALRKTDTRYEPMEFALRTRGVPESSPLAFHTPHGCSKGGADQYMLDYARNFGLPTVVLRMGCSYGPRQHGSEEQGWVAHFLISALEERAITVFGDGRQVRDLLFIDDLVDALLLCQTCMPSLAGRAFNIGGGPENSVSLIELLRGIARLHGSMPRVDHAPWRVGDQRYYVSDTRAFQAATGWDARVSAGEGIA